MPNTKNPGFTPARLAGISGGHITYVRRRAASNNSAEIATGDAVKADSNGNILGLGTSSTQSTAVDSVCMGVSYQDSTGARIGAKRLPASTTYTGTAFMAEDAIYIFCVENVTNVHFIASADEALSLTNLRNNFEIILGAARNGYSVQELDASTSATTATLPIRVVEPVVGPDNDLSAADAKFYCMVNVGQTEPALNTTGL